MTDDDAAIIRAGREQRVVPVVGHTPQSLLMMSAWTETQDRPVSTPTAEGRYTEPLQVPKGDIHSFDRPALPTISLESAPDWPNYKNLLVLTHRRTLYGFVDRSRSNQARRQS